MSDGRAYGRADVVQESAANKPGSPCCNTWLYGVTDLSGRLAGYYCKACFRDYEVDGVTPCAE